MAKLTDKNSFIGTLQSTDLIHIVDVNDLSQSPAGSSYKLTLAQLNAFLASGVTLQQVLTNNPSTGNIPVVSPNGSSISKRSDSGIFDGFYPATNSSAEIALTSLAATLHYDDGGSNTGIFKVLAAYASVNHSSSITLIAPLITVSQNATTPLGIVPLQQLQAYALGIGATAGGDLSGTYPNPAVLNSAVLAKLLTGLNITGSSLASTDNLLTAFGKLQNQLNGVLGGAIYHGTYNATTNIPSLVDGTGTQGWYYVVATSGLHNFGSGNIDLNIGDWIIYNGTIWQKVDNTDAVSSVNGFIGAVNLTTANISEVTNLYFTTARALATALTGYVSGAGTVSATDSILQAIQKLNGNIGAIVSGVSSVNGNTGAVTGLEITANKDASNGYAGLTLFKINFKNVLNTITSFFTNSNTASRTYTFPDKDITVAGLVDITGINSGTNTGDNATNTQYANDYRLANFVSGTNYLAPNGSAAALTGFPILNQSTTGTASTITGAITESQVTNLVSDLAGKQPTGTYASGTGSASGVNTGDETVARIATINHSATVKSVLVDADELTGQDSASTFSLIRTTLLNIFTYIQKKFETKTLIGDAAYSILASDNVIMTSVALTLPRIWTLPSAASVNAGNEKIIDDAIKTITATNTITVAVQTGQYLNNVLNGTDVIATGSAHRRLISDGVNNWTFDAGIARLSETQTLLAKTLVTPVIGSITGVSGATGLTVVTNNTASGAIAKGSNLTPTLIASANNDVLVGLDINPTFTVGAFTGVTKYQYRGVGFSISDIGRAVFTGAQFIGSVDMNNGTISNAAIIQSGNFGAANLILSTTNALSSILFKTNASIDAGRFFPSGNMTIQTGGTYTDAGYKLDVQGTLRAQATVTAVSALAQAVLVNPTLVASANNDVLVGLDITPTFTNGAFTGVKNVGLRVNSGQVLAISGTAAAPSYSFSSDPSSGFASAAVGAIAFVAGGSAVFYVDGGSVRIGSGKTFSDLGTGNAWFKFTGTNVTANDANNNYFTFTNGGTTVAPTITPAGTDANIDFVINAKGTGNLKVATGGLAITTVGKGISIKEGANAKMGLATLVAGVVTVSNTSVTANSRIFLTIQSLGTVTLPMAVGVTTITAGTSFVIKSGNVTDTSVVAYEIKEAL